MICQFFFCSSFPFSFCKMKQFCSSCFYYIMDHGRDSNHFLLLSWSPPFPGPRLCLALQKSSWTSFFTFVLLVGNIRETCKVGPGGKAALQLRPGSSYSASELAQHYLPIHPWWNVVIYQCLGKLAPDMCPQVFGDFDRDYAMAGEIEAIA